MDEEQYHILIVEDDLSIRDALAEFLGAIGYDADPVADGERGVEAFKKKSYDLAIVDFKLPGMDGIDVLKSLKSIDPDIVVIIMSGYASLESAIQAVKEGAYDYLTKPFKLDEIRVAVKNACEKVHLTRQQKVYVDELRRVNTEPVSMEIKEEAPKGGVEEASYSHDHNETEVILSELERLSALLNSGALSKEEFEKLKSGLLLKETPDV